MWRVLNTLRSALVEAQQSREAIAAHTAAHSELSTQVARQSEQMHNLEKMVQEMRLEKVLDTLGVKYRIGVTAG